MITKVPQDMQPREAYHLMLSIVAPRPIAWVSTIGANGMVNLAPFSFFTGVAGKPLTVMFSVGERRGSTKDTLRNVQEVGEFVVHVVDETLAEAMNNTSGDWPYGKSEFEVAGLHTIPSTDVRPPRIAEAAVALETIVSQIVPVDGTASTMVLGRIVRFHIREDLLRANGLVDAEKLRPVTRLGGEEYASFGKVFRMPRPKT